MVLTCSQCFRVKRCDDWFHDVTTCVKGSKPEEGGPREKGEEEAEEEKEQVEEASVRRPALTG